MRGSPTQRINNAERLSRLGVTAFNGGHPLWARYYFDRSVRREPTCGARIGGFYRAKALFDEEMMDRRTYASETEQQRELSRIFDCHWRAKHYFKRALSRHQHYPGMLQLLANEYEHLAMLSDRPQKAEHFRERAAYYTQAALDNSVDQQNMSRLAADVAMLKDLR